DGRGYPQAYSAYGAAPGQELRSKPSFVLFDQVGGSGPLSGARGTGQATAFAAGLAACMNSAGAPPSTDLRWLHLPPGGFLHAPDAWLRQTSQVSALRERQER